MGRGDQAVALLWHHVSSQVLLSLTLLPAALRNIEVYTRSLQSLGLWRAQVCQVLWVLTTILAEP